MKKFTTTVAFIVALIAPVAVLAHSDGELSPRESLMQQMMGESAFEAMEEVEEQMMGEEAQERMETLADKMFEGTLTADEQREMVALMQGSQTGQGAMLQMTRMMMPQAMMGSGLLNTEQQQTRWGMMGNVAWAGLVTPLWWSFWITTALVWVALVLSIIALIQYLTRNSPQK